LSKYFYNILEIKLKSKFKNQRKTKLKKKMGVAETTTKSLGDDPATPVWPEVGSAIPNHN